MQYKPKVEALKQVLGILVIFIITFPKFQILYGTGLDWSYKWALNHLFAYDYNQLVKLVYPIGPLGVLKMPIAIENNFLISLVCFCLVKVLFLYLCLETAKYLHKKNDLLVYLLILISAYFIHVDFLYIACTFLLCLLSYLKREKWLYYFIPAIAISAIGYFIKISIGISSLGIIFSLLAIVAFEQRGYKKLGINLFIIFCVYHLLGVIVFKGFSDFYAYVIGSLFYVKDYSSALSVYPENNWWALSVYLIALGCLIFIKKDKVSSIVLLLLVFPWFTSWKHAMSREHAAHYEVLIYFMLVFGPLLVLAAIRNSKVIGLVMIVAISCLFINYQIIKTHKEIVLEPIGINKFYDVVLDYENYNSTASSLSILDLNSDKLSDEIIASIGNSEVDVIPWELSYVPANDLNWKPRSNLQMGGFSHWFDFETKNNFDRETGPEKILYHLVNDKYKGDFGSIDNRLLLNDHPEAFKQILNKYNILQKFEDYIVFKKNERDNFLEPKSSETKQTIWNTWINVPKSNDELLRVKVESSVNLLGKIKGFFYKPEAYYIDYKLKNDSIYSYRYIASNAKDGLWLNPWLQNSYSNKKEPKVVSFRLRTTDDLFCSKEINYCFEKTRVAPQIKNGLYGLFDKNHRQMDTLLLSEIKTYDDTLNQKNELFRLEAKAFSESYEVDLENFWSSIPEDVTDLEIIASHDYVNKNSKGVLVFSIEGSPIKFWQGKKLEKANEQKKNVLLRRLTRSKHHKGKLVVYVWNNGESNIFIDNFQLTIKGQ